MRRVLQSDTARIAAEVGFPEPVTGLGHRYACIGLEERVVAVLRWELYEKGCPVGGAELPDFPEAIWGEPELWVRDDGSGVAAAHSWTETNLTSGWVRPSSA